MSLEITLRRLLPVAAVGILALCAAPLAAAAPAKTHKLAPRHGGKVTKAWPANRAVRRAARRPHRVMARALALQVGPVKPVKGKRAHSAAALPRASMAAAGVTAEPLPSAIGGTGPLRLVRSFEIPVADPSASRMANMSWTYDSALAATALTFAFEKSQAEQLLDQLAALQRTDGSIDYAYDVSTGAGIPLFRSGTVAWVGLSATMYRNLYGSSKYDTMVKGAAQWLMARQQASGLIAGGPDVTWASTQHNILAYEFLSMLEERPPSGLSASTLDNASDRIAAAVQSQLMVTVSSTQIGFKQGTNDDMRPLDVQALGMLMLEGLGRTTDAVKVNNYVASAFKLTGRSIVKSTAPETFNNSYGAAGPFTGYRPYATGGPDVLLGRGHRRGALREQRARQPRLRARLGDERVERAHLGCQQSAARLRPHRDRAPGQRVPRVADLGRRELDPDGPAQLLLELTDHRGRRFPAPPPPARCPPDGAAGGSDRAPGARRG